MSRPLYYTLENKVPVPLPHPLDPVLLVNAYKNRVVKFSELGNSVEVSTVFLVHDHGWGTYPPLLFETMIFGGPNDGYQRRYSSYEAAEDGHDEIVNRLTLADAHKN